MLAVQLLLERASYALHMLLLEKMGKLGALVKAMTQNTSKGFGCIAHEPTNIGVLR